MGLKLANNSESTLAAGINAAVTTLTVQAGHGARFPTCVDGNGDFFFVTLVNVAGQREVIKVTRHDAGTDVFQVMERAADPIANASSATAYVFAQDDVVQMRTPAVLMQTTDTTESATFQLDSQNTGPLLKNNSGVMEIRNAADSAYANLKALGMTLTDALVIAGSLTGVTSLTMAGALSGVTTLAMSGALSGVTSLAMGGALSGVTTLALSGATSGGTDITISGTLQAEHIASTDDIAVTDDLTVGGLATITGTSSIPIDNEATSKKIKARDHGTVTDPEVVNVVYGTGSPPAASGTPIGTLFIKYV